MREIEAEFFGIDEGAFLLDTFAEGLTEGPVGEVGSSVIFFRTGSCRGNFGLDSVADGDLSLADAADVKGVPADCLCCLYVEFSAR